MAERGKETRQLWTDRRLIKIGGSLVVSVPNEVIEEWNLKKGDEVRVSVGEGGIRIEPKRPTKLHAVSEGSIEAYSKLMKGVEARVTMDSEASALHLEFSGENREAVRLLLYNLWRNLPFLLNMIGLGSVEGLTKPGERREKREET
jgi:antitoxin component of MazEF toxin-antitoxin module